MCWETSLTKCYPLRNNRATITSFIVLGLTLGLGPGRDAKLIFTNGGSYIQHLQLPLRLSTTTVQYQIWNGPNALFNWDIFWHFLQFSCKWCSFGRQQTASVWIELMTNWSWSAVEPCLSCPGHISDSESAGKMKMISLMICLPSRCHHVAKTPHFPPLQ